jgi:hypothetical protein
LLNLFASFFDEPKHELLCGLPLLPLLGDFLLENVGHEGEFFVELVLPISAGALLLGEGLLEAGNFRGDGAY